MTSRIVLASVILVSVAGIAARRRSASSTEPASAERRLEAPIAIRKSFRHFSDSAGRRLLDTLFTLGYHGGYSWDEKSGAVPANLVAETDSASVTDSVSGIYEGIISLDLHHDVNTDVPASLSMRFVNVGKPDRWVLLTTDGLPEDPSDDQPIEDLRKLPADLHGAISGSFSDRADAFAFWKAIENSGAQTGVNTAH